MANSLSADYPGLVLRCRCVGWPVCCPDVVKRQAGRLAFLPANAC